MGSDVSSLYGCSKGTTMTTCDARPECAYINSSGIVTVIYGLTHAFPTRNCTSSARAQCNSQATRCAHVTVALANPAVFCELKLNSLPEKAQNADTRAGNEEHETLASKLPHNVIASEQRMLCCVFALYRRCVASDLDNHAYTHANNSIH